MIDRPDLISQLIRIPHSWSHSHVVPLGNILLDTGATRDEVLAVVGTVAKPLEIAGWSISFDKETDRVRFQRKQSASATTATAAAVRTAPAAPVEFDPQKVGRQAQQYQAEQRKAGREISTTQAVAHVLGRR